MQDYFKNCTTASTSQNPKPDMVELIKEALEVLQKSDIAEHQTIELEKLGFFLSQKEDFKNLPENTQYIINNLAQDFTKRTYRNFLTLKPIKITS